MKEFFVEKKDFIPSSWSKNNPKTCVVVAIKEEGVAVRNSNDPRRLRCFLAMMSGGLLLRE